MGDGLKKTFLMLYGGREMRRIDIDFKRIP
jgi:hypothetical protein